MAKRSKNNEWNEVKGMTGFSTIGTEDRFSISCEVYDGMRITINGCRVVNGKNGEFISFPAWKGSDGAYHDYAYMTFDRKEVEKIIDSLN